MKPCFAMQRHNGKNLGLHSRTATEMGVVVGQRAALGIDWIFGILHPGS